MGFLDKVKNTAQQVAEKAQEGAKQGQEKIQEARAKRSADAVLKDLGTVLYLDRTGRGTPQLTAEVERLTAELRDMEDKGTVIEPPVASPAPAPEPSAEPAPSPAPAPAPTSAPTGGAQDPVSDPAAPAAEGPGPAPAGDFNLDDV